MRRGLLVALFGTAATLASVSHANASTIVLDFEGLGQQEQVLDFYNGGTGSLGHSGTNYGISFGADSLALIDADAPGGTGNFANEPSASTVLFFLAGQGDVMNVAAGFDTGFSFFYSANVQDGIVQVFSGLNGTGSLLGSLLLPFAATPQSGCGGGDPNGTYSCWAPVGVTFAGLAHSVIFSGAANFVGFDNITLGSDTPGGGGQVPEPTTMVLLGTGIAAAAVRRFRNRA